MEELFRTNYFFSQALAAICLRFPLFIRHVLTLKRSKEGRRGGGAIRRPPPLIFFGLKILPHDQLRNVFAQLFLDNEHIF